MTKLTEETTTIIACVATVFITLVFGMAIGIGIGVRIMRTQARTCAVQPADLRV